MVQNQSSGDVEISVAIISVDKFGHDAAGSGRSIMCACSFRCGETCIRWLGSPEQPKDLLLQVGREIVPLLETNSQKVIPINNGSCLDEWGQCIVNGKMVASSVISWFHEWLRRHSQSAQNHMESNPA